MANTQNICIYFVSLSEIKKIYPKISTCGLKVHVQALPFIKKIKWSYHCALDGVTCIESLVEQRVTILSDLEAGNDTTSTATLLHLFLHLLAVH